MIQSSPCVKTPPSGAGFPLNPQSPSQMQKLRPLNRLPKLQNENEIQSKLQSNENKLF